MDEIPEDVMKAAWEANQKARVISPRDRQATIIARAIMAERERCAKIADKWAHRDTGWEIASAIRSPRPTDMTDGLSSEEFVRKMRDEEWHSPRPTDGE